MMRGLIFAILICAKIGLSPSFASTFITPTIEVDSHSLNFADDLDFKNLNLAIQRQIDAYDSGIALKGSARFGGHTFNLSILKDSLVLFQELARSTAECLQKKSDRAPCLIKFNESIRSRFRVFRPKPSETKFTAYYSPDFNGSLTPRDRYQLPLYSTPADPTLAESTREEITFDHVLKGRGLECAYIDADLFELYSLQVEGGGRIHLFDENGKETLKYISYQSKNSKSLRFFSKLMLDQGYLTLADQSYATQHRVFLAHPEIQRSLYSQSPSYVYFKLSDQEPLGINNIPLTENRSLAFDPAHYPASGILNFIRVTVNGKEITRFMLGQDVGGAIKGPARADLYFGFGVEAREAAESLGALGNQYFLIKRSVASRTLRLLKH